MISLTIPEVVALGCSRIRVLPISSLPRLAGLAVRGFVVLFPTLALLRLAGAFLRFLSGIRSSWRRNTSHAVPFRTGAKCPTGFCRQHRVFGRDGQSCSTSSAIGTRWRSAIAMILPPFRRGPGRQQRWFLRPAEARVDKGFRRARPALSRRGTATQVTYRLKDVMILV